MTGKTPGATVDGLAGLHDRFVQLADTMQRKTAREMARDAAGVIRNEARRLARAQGLRQSGALIRNFAIKRERTAPGLEQYHVGVRRGRDLRRRDKANAQLVVSRQGRIVKTYQNNPFYYRFLETGTRKMPAHPTVGPALVAKQDAALDAAERRLALALSEAGR